MQDLDIIELYLKRKECAISETEKKYGNYLYQIAYRILKDRSDGEEMVNDTYMGAWNAIPPTKPDCLRHFLSRITRNLSLNRLEYHLAGKRNSLVVELDECIPSENGNPEDAWEIKEIGESLNRFLHTLDKKTCAVFLAHYYYAYSYRELADRYGMTQRQVKYLMSCTREKLRVYFENEGVIL